MPDLFKCYNGDRVDLDDPDTYKSEEWVDADTTLKLHARAWSELGKSLYYMQYFHPDMVEDEQAARIHGFCFWYAQEHRNHFEDTAENRMWFRKFIYKFKDEVENQC